MSLVPLLLADSQSLGTEGQSTLFLHHSAGQNRIEQGGAGERFVEAGYQYYEADTRCFESQAVEVIDDLDEALRVLPQEYRVEYCDSSNASRLAARSEFLVDSDHLNMCGRRAFTMGLPRAMAESDLSG